MREQNRLKFSQQFKNDNHNGNNFGCLIVTVLSIIIWICIYFGLIKLLQ